MGLKAAGLSVECQRPSVVDKDTVLLIWNRYADNHDLACTIERAGGRVWVAENGYLGKRGKIPKFDVHPAGPSADSYYAVSEGFHNGGGRWPKGNGERWEKLEVDVKPWREAGSHILICPNRSFGVAGRVMHPDWAERTAARLRLATKRQIRIRAHPGNDAPKRSLHEDLCGAWAIVVWSSSCGVHALVEGIPTYVEAPFWVMKDASASGHIDAPILPDRRQHFESLAWQQWSVEEIASGEPFTRLLAL